MTDRRDARELRIRGYARETALCVDLPLSALEDEILRELASSSADETEALKRLLNSVRAHRKLVADFTKA